MDNESIPIESNTEKTINESNKSEKKEMPNIKNLSSVRNHIFILYFSFILYNIIDIKTKEKNQ